MKKRNKIFLCLFLAALNSFLLQADNTHPYIQSEMNIVSQQNEVTISGVVKDTNGEALTGVSVSVPGTTIGTMTDLDGKYSLKVPLNSEIQFSFMGFKPQIIKISSEKTIDVILEEDTMILDEIVVVGFGSQKKVNLTGSVSSIDTKMLESRPVSNVTQSLQGLIPGLNISSNNGGEIGTSSSINVRGMATIGDSNGSPLILIDGMEADISMLNPNDVQSISVLKDAAASSIYGSRAPFGVILITTKQGKAGRVQINYNNNLRWSSPLSTPKMSDSYSFALFMNDLLTNAGRDAWFKPEQIQRILDYQAGKLGNSTIIPSPHDPTIWDDAWVSGNDNIDWYKEIYKTGAFSQEHSMSISGGNEKNSYYISGNFLDQDGLLKIGDDALKRYTATAKISSNIASWAKIDYSGRFVRLETTRPETYRGQHDFWFAMQAWPTLPLYDPNGYYFSAPSAALYLADGGKNDYTSDAKYHQLGVTLEPVKNMKVIGNINYSITDDFRRITLNKMYNHNVAGKPILYRSDNSIKEYAYKNNYLNADLRSEYKKSFDQKHNFMLMGGFQAEQSKYRDLSALKTGIYAQNPSLDTSTGVADNGSVVAPKVSGGYSNWSTTGFFGRLNYDYMGRYLLEANLRYDGTSRFRAHERWNWFPSASIGWNIAEEGFWSNLRSSVEVLKLRASWGKLGNQNTNGYYPTYQSIRLDSENGKWLVNGMVPNMASSALLISRSLTWEKIKTYNLGLDLSSLNNRLTTSFDTYVRYTNDMVGPAADLPALLGTPVPKTNNTDLKTQGFELEISWKDRLANGLSYNIRFNVSDSKTKILKYPNEAELIGFKNTATGEVSYDRYRNGETYGDIWGYETVGIAKTKEEMDAHLSKLTNGGQNALGTNWGAGDIMYADTNGDGKIDDGARTLNDHGDLKVIGNITPRYIFGLNFGADYKGVDFSMFFQGVMKRDYFQDSYLFWGSGDSMWGSTAFVEHLDYFRSDPNHPLGQNLDAYYPRPIDGMQNLKNQEVQTRYMQNGAYIRLKMLQIGYSLPQPILSKLSLQRVRFYASGENLWTGTKLTKIFDPELIDNQGSGGVQYPLSKVFSFGINVTF